MSKLENEVRSVVNSFMQSGELFTALDVSNKVKMNLPFARHREVRDIVRAMFTSDIEPAGWARTPIQVSLPDGTATEALLYHPIRDSWDLDNKYDAQKRAQGSVHAAASAGSSFCSTPAAVPAPVSSTDTVTAPVTTTSVPAMTAVDPRDLWAQLFNQQPSLFPRK